MNEQITRFRRIGVVALGVLVLLVAILVGQAVIRGHGGRKTVAIGEQGTAARRRGPGSSVTKSSSTADAATVCLELYDALAAVPGNQAVISQLATPALAQQMIAAVRTQPVGVKLPPPRAVVLPDGPKEALLSTPTQGTVVCKLNSAGKVATFQ